MALSKLRPRPLTTNPTDEVFHPFQPTSSTHQVLGNDVLLGLIFSKCEDYTDSLRTYRLVNKKWNAVAKIGLLRENHKRRNFVYLNAGIRRPCLKEYLMILTGQINARNFKNVVSISQATQQDEHQKPKKIIPQMPIHDCFILCGHNKFVKLRKHGRFVKFFFGLLEQRIKAVYMYLPMGSRDRGLLNSIVQKQSTSLTELKISLDCRETVDESGVEELHTDSQLPLTQDNGVDMELFKLNALQYLCIKMETLCNINPSENPTILDILLKKVPNGKAIKLAITELHWNDIEKMMEKLHKYEFVKNLSILHVIDTPGTNLRSLREADVCLKFLHLASGENTGTNWRNFMEETYQLLRNQAKNLEMLVWESGWGYKFPECMPALKKLALMPPTSCQHHLVNLDQFMEWLNSLRPLIYINMFPKLEELNINCSHIRNLEWLQFRNSYIPEQTPCQTVRKLGILYDDIGLELIACISNTFPCLTSLSLTLILNCHSRMRTKQSESLWFARLFDASFALTLKHLTIFYDDSSCREYRLRPKWKDYEVDAMFSGVNVKVVRETTRKQEWANQPGRSSLLNFLNLETLTILGQEPFTWENGKFTDFSVYCLFGQMNTLRSVTLSAFICEFSQSAKDHLQQKLFTVRIGKKISAEERIEEVFDTSFDSAVHFNADRWMKLHTGHPAPSQNLLTFG